MAKKKKNMTKAKVKYMNPEKIAKSLLETDEKCFHRLNYARKNNPCHSMWRECSGEALERIFNRLGITEE